MKFEFIDKKIDAYLSMVFGIILKQKLIDTKCIRLNPHYAGDTVQTLESNLFNFLKKNYKNKLPCPVSIIREHNLIKIVQFIECTY